MRQQLLLIDDVDDLGSSGEIVSVKAGYARNFLIPQKKAVIASKETLRMQERLKKERAIKAEKDKKEAEELATIIQGKVLSIDVKVDPEGKMYGSVAARDIVELFAKEGINIEKKFVQLKHPMKEIGAFEISLRLKEGVMTTCQLKIVAEEEKK